MIGVTFAGLSFRWVDFVGSIKRWAGKPQWSVDDIRNTVSIEVARPDPFRIVDIGQLMSRKRMQMQILADADSRAGRN